MNITINVTETKPKKGCKTRKHRRGIDPGSRHTGALLRIDDQMDRLLQIMERMANYLSDDIMSPFTSDKNPAPFGVASGDSWTDPRHETGRMSSPDSNLAPGATTPLGQAAVDALADAIKVGGFPMKPFKGATPF
jgi:hypothetical protein